MTIKELKEQQKVLAKDIKDKKQQRKKARYGYVVGLDNLKFEYRHRHIAYCLFRGRTMEEIERSCREAPDEHLIYRYKSEIEVPETKPSSVEVGNG